MWRICEPSLFTSQKAGRCGGARRRQRPRVIKHEPTLVPTFPRCGTCGSACYRFGCVSAFCAHDCFAGQRGYPQPQCRRMPVHLRARCCLPQPGAPVAGRYEGYAMNRRFFLRLLGVAPVALPAAEVAMSGPPFASGGVVAAGSGHLVGEVPSESVARKADLVGHKPPFYVEDGQVYIETVSVAAAPTRMRMVVS